MAIEPIKPILVSESTRLEGCEIITPTVKELSKVSLVRSVGAVAFDWTIILSTTSLALYFENIFTTLLAIVVIGCRQHGLAVLMHEAAHFRLIGNHYWNDKVANFLLAYPLFITTKSYRQNHLAHHNNLNTDADPDWISKQNKPEWDYPMSKSKMHLIFLKTLFGGGALYAIRLIFLFGNNGAAKEEESAKSELLIRIAYYTLVVAILSWLQLWGTFLVYWLVPLLTVLPMVVKFRSVSEHLGVDASSDLSASRTTNCPAWEKFLLAPHNIHYHLEHHLYPSVCFSNLPALRDALEQLPDFRENVHVHSSYFFSSNSVYNELTENRR